MTHHSVRTKPLQDQLSVSGTGDFGHGGLERGEGVALTAPKVWLERVRELLDRSLVEAAWGHPEQQRKALVGQPHRHVHTVAFSRWTTVLLAPRTPAWRLG